MPGRATRIVSPDWELLVDDCLNGSNFLGTRSDTKPQNCMQFCLLSFEWHFGSLGKKRISFVHFSIRLLWGNLICIGLLTKMGSRANRFDPGQRLVSKGTKQESKPGQAYLSKGDEQQVWRSYSSNMAFVVYGREERTAKSIHESGSQGYSASVGRGFKRKG